LEGPPIDEKWLWRWRCRLRIEAKKKKSSRKFPPPCCFPHLRFERWWKLVASLVACVELGISFVASDVLKKVGGKKKEKK
jgi:hypothetical protein